MNETQTREFLHRARDGIAVGVPPVAEVMAAGAKQRRVRRAGWVGAGVATAALAVGVAVVAPGAFQRGDGRLLAHAANPANIPWWADGVLHLANVEVEAANLDTMVQVRNGVVYWSTTETGSAPTPVVHVDEEGTATTIGDKSQDSPIASDPTTGWVAWVNDTETTPPILMSMTPSPTKRSATES